MLSVRPMAIDRHMHITLCGQSKIRLLTSSSPFSTVSTRKGWGIVVEPSVPSTAPSSLAAAESARGAFIGAGAASSVPCPIVPPASMDAASISAALRFLNDEVSEVPGTRVALDVLPSGAYSASAMAVRVRGVGVLGEQGREICSGQEEWVE